MRRYSLIHVGVAAALAAATITAVGVIQYAGAAGGTKSAFTPIAPCRLADTRGADGIGDRRTPIGGAETVPFTVWGSHGACSIPITATGITANVTVVNPSAGSFLTVFPADVVRPNASNLNYSAGQAPVPNSVTVSLSADGKIGVYNNAGRVDVIIDINGYYEPVTAIAGPKGDTGATGPVSASCVALIRWDTCNRTTATVTVGANPEGVAFDGTSIWVTNPGSGTVSKINPTTNTVTATVTVGSSPSGVAFDGTSIWVTNRISGTVSKINPTTNTVTATVTVGSSPSDVAFDGANVWVTNAGSGTVSKIPV